MMSSLCSIDMFHVACNNANLRLQYKSKAAHHELEAFLHGVIARVHEVHFSALHRHRTFLRNQLRRLMRRFDAVLLRRQ